MSFRLKLQLAMLLLVASVTGATLVVLQRNVETTYRTIFQQRFRSDVELRGALRRARLAAVETRCLALARSVRLIAALIGSWAARHDSWANPFVNAPLPYENVTTISDGSAPDTPQAFLARRDVPDRKRDWVPVVWGPSYTTGGAVFGRIGRFDWAAEAKNAALSARPEAWDARRRGFDDPTGSGRLGWRPGAAWVLGTSFSSGPYLRANALRTLAPSQALGDFRETVVGADASFARRHLELWAEFFAARFEVPIPCRSRTRPPSVEDADTAAWYVEGRYKLTPELYAALRWNQQLFGDVPDGQGGERPWDRDAWRVDVAGGYRFHRRLQAKLQYGYLHQAGHLQQGEQLVAAQLTLRF
jgi:hypothetical protein